ncbi:hypothetical protein Pmani_027187 [Petrolisthes manimaculis]|uniref:Uncharacterized protein n=1 Tax=Petrolisthes manimaculis TaxID=1843537 RepID=A0AAE1P4N9_9EUCA|nr:hypothetical protein Pmani_027187 [Petrolisthes manimaculis]
MVVWVEGGREVSPPPHQLHPQLPAHPRPTHPRQPAHTRPLRGYRGRALGARMLEGGKEGVERRRRAKRGGSQ